jgi:hypothetical protein
LANEKELSEVLDALRPGRDDVDDEELVVTGDAPLFPLLLTLPESLSLE